MFKPVANFRFTTSPKLQNTIYQRQYIRETKTFMQCCIFSFIVVSSDWANIFGEGHYYCLDNPHDQAGQALEGGLVGGLEDEQVQSLCLSNGWAEIYPEGHCFVLVEGQEEEAEPLVTWSVWKRP